MIVKVIFLNVLLLVFSACTINQDSLNSIEKHTVQSNELRILMHELDMVVYDRYKSELERDDMRRRYAITLADNIKELTENINNIPEDKLGQNINKTDMKIFYTYLKELYKNANEIDLIAQNYELEKLDSKIADMKSVCNNCHLKFRSN